MPVLNAQLKTKVLSKILMPLFGQLVGQELA
jgi:hypothetical protein